MDSPEKTNTNGTTTTPVAQSPENRVIPRKASMASRRASFFIGDAEGNKIPVKIVGPDEQEIPAEDIVVPPDGGYGYVIVFAAFMSNVIVDGIVFTFSPIKDSIKKASNNQIEDATIAWVGSLLIGFYLMAGPFVSAIANRYGFRVVAVLGSLIASASFTVAWYLNRGGPNLGVLITFYGIIGGIGFSCIYVPAVIAVGFYFEKKRALATGIAICGSGIGGFLFPKFILTLQSKFGWQGAILSLGVTVLFCGLLGLLYKPLKPTKQRRMSQMSPTESPDGTPLLMRIKKARDMMKHWDSVNSFTSNRESYTDVQKANEEGKPKSRAEKLYNQARKTSTPSLRSGTNPIAIPTGLNAKRASVPSMLSTGGESPSFPQGAGVLASLPNKGQSLKAKSFVGLPDLHEIEEEHGSDEAGSRENSVGPAGRMHLLSESATTDGRMDKDEKASLIGMNNGTRKSSVISCRIGNSMLLVDEMTNSRIIRVASKVTLNKPLYRDDIFYSGSLYRIPDYANNVMTSTEWTAAVTSPPVEPEVTVTDSKKSTCCSCEIVKRMLDVSLLLSPTFIVFCVSGMFSMMGLFIPFFYLTDQAKDALSSNANPPDQDTLTWLISTIGAANTVGRVLSGWIADRPWVDALVLNNGALGIMGVACLIVPLLKSYTQFIAYCCAFGISMACFASLRSILVVELLGLAKLTNAFGLLLLFQGIASMIATPLAGNIVQMTGNNYGSAFYTAGFFLVLSMVMCLPLNRLNQWEKNRNKEKTNDASKGHMVQA